MHRVVECVADGVLRAVQIADPALRRGQYKRRHRRILEALNEFSELKERYVSVVLRFIDDEREIDTAEWQGTWVPVILQLVEALSGAEVNSTHLDEFLTWPAAEPEEAIPRTVRRKDNHYRYPAHNPCVNIRVGSIHSVKGETHTATLVLDTFFHDHHLRALRPWLMGRNSGQGTETQRMQSRLKQHYVAFTRPTHLLCIAMRDELSAEDIQSLKDRTWRVGHAQPDGTLVWL